MDKDPKSMFFSDSCSVIHNPNNFVIEFQQQVPVWDTTTKNYTFRMVSTRVVMLPGQMRSFLSMIQQNVGMYEKSFGALKETSPVKSESLAIKPEKTKEACTQGYID